VQRVPPVHARGLAGQFGRGGFRSARGWLVGVVCDRGGKDGRSWDDELCRVRVARAGWFA
jgi:hypothetical protein